VCNWNWLWCDLAFIGVTLRHARKDKVGSTVPAHDAEAVIIVQGVDKGKAVPSERTTKGVFHDTRLHVHAFGQDGAHEPLDGEQLGLLGKAVACRRVGRKEGQPGGLVVFVGLDLAAGDPDGIARGILGVGDHVTVGGHGAANGAGDVLVGGVGVGGHGWFNGKGGNDAEIVEKSR